MENGLIYVETYKQACDIDKPLADQIKKTMEDKERTLMELLLFFKFKNMPIIMLNEGEFEFEFDSD